MAHYDEYGYNKDGWNRENVHKDTRTKYGKDERDRDGLDKYRKDKDGKYHPTDTEIRYDDFGH